MGNPGSVLWRQGSGWAPARQVLDSSPLLRVTHPVPDVTVTVDRSAPVGVSRLLLGVTHAQYSVDPSGDDASVARAMPLLQSSTVLQNQHIMGWGADNPEPSPGVFDWTSLDERLRLIRASGGTPVITLCCAPDWMKGGRAGSTDWSKLELAPTPAHYGDFAALARQVALRYPDVRYFQVWNELKGFWRQAGDRPDYEAYTSFYNTVYDALKAVNPDLQVGGPYVILDSDPARVAGHPSALRGPYGVIDQRALDTITYWLDHKHGAEFVTVDASSFDNAPSDPFAALQKFRDISVWLRARTSLPLWWAEWYVTPWDGEATFDAAAQNALMTAALLQMIQDGDAAALRWQPQGAAGGSSESVWTDTRAPGGGRPYPFYYSARALRTGFGPGMGTYATAVSNSDVAALASVTHTVIVNKTPRRLVVNVDGRWLALNPHQVRVVAA